MLRNAVGWWSDFREKVLCGCIQFNAISVRSGWIGVEFPEKKTLGL